MNCDCFESYLKMFCSVLFCDQITDVECVDKDNLSKLRDESKLLLRINIPCYITQCKVGE